MVKNWLSLSPPLLSPGTSDRAEIFFTDTRDSVGCLFIYFFFLSRSVPKKSQNTENTLESACFSVTTFFVTSAKHRWYNIFQNKK